MMELTVLCKVVDNFGDIGFVWRLCKNLLTLQGRYEIRLIVDGLDSFKKIEPEILEEKAEQDFRGIRVFDARAAGYCHKEFSKNPPRVILECFQCGRPEWLEKILFDENEKIPHIVQIINIEYLTAEDYADEFHCLKSGTRCARVRKVNFMPGFTAKTGGLILDEPFLGQYAARKKGTPHSENSIPQILFFSYRNDFTAIFRAVKKFIANLNGNVREKQAKICINLAQGAGKAPFLEAYSEFFSGPEKGIFAINELRYLPQEEWDKTMCGCDILFVRGEDSLSRACLCGKPFVWQAYPQDENYQLVKVNALLARMRPCFCEEDFTVIKNFWLLYNGGTGTDTGGDSFGKDSSSLLENACLEFLCRAEKLKSGFEKFSDLIFANGNFTEHLDSFIKNFT